MMSEEQKITLDKESPKKDPSPDSSPADKALVPFEAPIDATEEKSSDDSKALAIVVEKEPAETSPEKPSSASFDRDVKLADLSNEKRLSFVRAWEDSEKSKAENKAEKKVSDVVSWESSKKANVEAQLKKIEEQLEKKKAEYAEKMKNKVAAIHKEAQERRAMIQAKRGEDILKAEETAAKYRATGIPKPTCGCF